jgi:hypothetical protein
VRGYFATDDFLPTTALSVFHKFFSGRKARPSGAKARIFLGPDGTVEQAAEKVAFHAAAALSG